MKIFQVVQGSNDGDFDVHVDSDVFKAYPALERSKKVIEQSEAKKLFDDYMEALKPGKASSIAMLIPALGGASTAVSMMSSVYAKFKVDETPHAIYKSLWKDFQAFAKEFDKGAIPLHRNDVALRFPESAGIGLGFYTVHPMKDDRLVPVEDFHTALKDEKDSELMDLMRIMGATSISIVDRLSNEIGGSASVVEAASGAGGTFGVGGKSGTETMTKATMSGHSEEVPDDLLSSSIWFRNDPKVLSIFKGRKQGNRINSFTLQNTYTQSFGFDFDMALKVTKVDLKSKFEKLRRVERVFEVSFS